MISSDIKVIVLVNINRSVFFLFAKNKQFFYLHIIHKPYPVFIEVVSSKRSKWQKCKNIQKWASLFICFDYYFYNLIHFLLSNIFMLIFFSFKNLFFNIFAHATKKVIRLYLIQRRDGRRKIVKQVRIIWDNPKSTCLILIKFGRDHVRSTTFLLKK